MVRAAPPTLYLDASLLTDNGAETLELVTDLGLSIVVVEDQASIPTMLADDWHLTDQMPEAGSPRWSRTVLIGPRREPGRRAVTGLRTARSVRVAVLELASEHSLD
jgi:hypothetical protein